MTMKLTLSRRVETTLQAYPRQFWLLFTGMLISTVGTSMIWPFLMIYVTEKLSLSAQHCDQFKFDQFCSGDGLRFRIRSIG